MATLDLREKDSLEIFMNVGTSAVITFSGITSLDSGYTISLPGDDPQTYTVGSGLTLGANSIIWTLDTTSFTETTYEGTLESDSKVIGVYKNIKITVKLA